MYKIGFIGSGKMAGAIIKGLIKTSFAKPEELIATQAETEGIDEKSRELGIKIILDNKELAQNSEVIFIATKPNQAADVLHLNRTGQDHGMDHGAFWKRVKTRPLYAKYTGTCRRRHERNGRRKIR